jgi:hypothetical protein
MTDMVLYMCHVTRSKRQCRPTRKACECSCKTIGFRNEHSAINAHIVTPLCRLGTASASLFRGSTGFGFQGDSKIQSGIYGENSRRPGEKAQAKLQDPSMHTKLSCRAGAGGVLVQNAWQDERWRIDKSKFNISSIGWANIILPRHTGFSFLNGENK